MSTATQDWKPRRYERWNGDRYCSPACGHECLREDYERAQTLAKAMCAQLGEGWKPRVWENMGWHSSAVKGKIEIHRNGSRSYWADFSSSVRQFYATRTTPKQALQDVLRQASTAKNALVRELEAFS